MSERDQRSAPRVLHSITAKVKVGENPAFGAKTMDLSQGGALLDCPYQLPLGEKLELAFKLGKHELTPTVCEVRRVESAFGGRRALAGASTQIRAPARLLLLTSRGARI